MKDKFIKKIRIIQKKTLLGGFVEQSKGKAINFTDTSK